MPGIPAPWTRVALFLEKAEPFFKFYTIPLNAPSAGILTGSWQARPFGGAEETR